MLHWVAWDTSIVRGLPALHRNDRRGGSRARSRNAADRTIRAGCVRGTSRSSGAACPCGRFDRRDPMTRTGCDGAANANSLSTSRNSDGTRRAHNRSVRVTRVLRRRKLNTSSASGVRRSISDGDSKHTGSPRRSTRLSSPRRTANVRSARKSDRSTSTMITRRSSGAICCAARVTVESDSWRMTS